MAGKAKGRIVLTDAERQGLERLQRAGKTQQRLRLRVDIVLRSADGETDTKIARGLGTTGEAVGKWRRRYIDFRLEGLRDSPRSGKPPKYNKQTDEKILAKLDESPPTGYSVWNGRLLAKALGISDDYVWRFLRRRSISLQRRRSWCVSTDPEFTVKATDVVGLYLAPPENAIVLCVDEKPSIQALERNQGWLKLPDGRSLTGFSHEYKRRGTSTLIAALEVSTGLVKAGHFKTKTKKDFTAFLDTVLGDLPKNNAVHVICDNFSSHKNLAQDWLDSHPNLTFHFTPTHASWLNQIETWFSILWRGALRGASFGSVKELCKRIDDFIKVYNQEAHPFEWRRATTTPKSLSHSLANLCN
jgi:transposase